MICSICNCEIEVEHGGWYKGHNAEPFEGRCCKACNDKVVIPTRIGLLLKPAQDSDVPKIIKDSINRYIKHNRPCGSFLRAVISNDLHTACLCADDNNKRDLIKIVKYVNDVVPHDMRGSRSAYETVIKKIK